jgi:hypothetical protein
MFWCHFAVDNFVGNCGMDVVGESGRSVIKQKVFLLVSQCDQGKIDPSNSLRQ